MPRSDLEDLRRVVGAGAEAERARALRRGPRASSTASPTCRERVEHRHPHVDGGAVDDHLHAARRCPAARPRRGLGQPLEHGAQVHLHRHLPGVGVEGAGGGDLERPRPRRPVIVMTISKAAVPASAAASGRRAARRRRPRRSATSTAPSSASVAQAATSRSGAASARASLRNMDPSQGAVWWFGRVPRTRPSRRAAVRRSVPSRRIRAVGAAYDDRWPTTGRGAVNRKQALSLVLRLGLSALMLGVLIWRIPPIDARRGHPRAHRSHRRCGWSSPMALTLAGLVLSALRWQRVLEVLGLHAGLRRLLSHYLAGQFVSNVLPTTIGGDVLRVSRLSRETGESPKTFASVVLERLTGWLVLPVISVVGFLVNPPLQHLGRATQVARRARLRHAPRARASSCTPWPTSGSAAASRPATAGAASPARCTSASTGSAAQPAAAANVLLVGLRLPARARAGRGGRRPGAGRRGPPGSPRCSPSSRPSPSPRCCRSASPGSACARAPSCSSSARSASPPQDAIALGPAALPAQPRREPARRARLRRRRPGARAREPSPDA